MKTRWTMRNSNGNTWITAKEYTKEEAELFMMCQPVAPYIGESDVPQQPKRSNAFRSFMQRLMPWSSVSK